MTRRVNPLSASVALCTANQLTGFYMRATLALNGLNNFVNLEDKKKDSKSRKHPITDIKLKHRDALRDLLPFVQFKKRKNIHGGVLLLEELQVEACKPATLLKGTKLRKASYID